jgi:hypothetical protein
MLWMLVALAGVLASEAMLRLPLIATIKGVVKVSQKSMRLLKSKRISDHWKERVLPAYSLRMAKGSVGFFLLLCAGLLPSCLSRRAGRLGRGPAAAAGHSGAVRRVAGLHLAAREVHPCLTIPPWTNCCIGWRWARWPR